VPGGNGCTLNTYYVRPRSRGAVTLRSADPREAPDIDPNPYADRYDLERTIDGLEVCREILSQPAIASFIRQEHLPGAAVRDRAALEVFAREHGRSAYHPVGTCRMGKGAEAVVDPQLRLHGVDRLRVCDSSIMPRIVSSNTNAATIMIAEKAADLIRGRDAA
jgi:choline dehydrogenase-like flavoprotein